jgi:hypothetical protein
VHYHSLTLGDSLQIMEVGVADSLIF